MATLWPSKQASPGWAQRVEPKCVPGIRVATGVTRASPLAAWMGRVDPSSSFPSRAEDEKNKQTSTRLRTFTLPGGGIVTAVEWRAPGAHTSRRAHVQGRGECEADTSDIFDTHRRVVRSRSPGAPLVPPVAEDADSIPTQKAGKQARRAGRQAGKRAGTQASRPFASSVERRTPGLTPGHEARVPRNKAQIASIPENNTGNSPKMPVTAVRSRSPASTLVRGRVSLHVPRPGTVAALSTCPIYPTCGKPQTVVHLGPVPATVLTVTS